MNIDCPEGIRVTADSQNVRPGMIYVDLSCRKNRRQIYEAYENGAYLIFTPYNISDPALPVIKVESPQKHFLCYLKNSSRRRIIMLSSSEFLAKAVKAYWSRCCREYLTEEMTAG